MPCRTANTNRYFCHGRLTPPIGRIFYQDGRISDVPDSAAHELFRLPKQILDVPLLVVLAFL